MFSARRALVVLLACVAIAAGCAQEGKLIDTPLPVNGIAIDRVLFARKSYFTGTVTAPVLVVYDSVEVKFKLSVHTLNACEAKHAFLELRRVGTDPGLVYVIRPIARYNLDDACVALGGVAGDTVLTLKLGPLRLTGSERVHFRIDSANGPGISVDVDTTLHSSIASTVEFDVRAEASTGAATPGATVTIDRLGASPGLLGGGPTDANGEFQFNAATADTFGAAALPYRVTVTNGPDTRVISVPSFPARGQSRERVIVRL